MMKLTLNQANNDFELKNSPEAWTEAAAAVWRGRGMDFDNLMGFPI